MILGAHTFILVDHWSDGALDVLDRMAGLGLGCAEISLGDDVVFTPELTRKRAERLGLTLVASPGGLWPASCDISSDDPGERAAGVEWHKRQIDTAAALGAVAYTGALYGHPGTVRRRIPPADEPRRVADGLRALAEHAARAGVALALEPMSHFRTHVANTAAQVMRLVELAGHDNLRVLLDTYHLVTETRDYAGEVRTAAPRLWGIHACENDRGVPGGGLVPWSSVCAALAETRFDGFILFETYNSSLGDFAWRRGLFHDVCPDGEAFIRTGLAFIRRHIDANHQAH
ncbi:sugar phosphate isomerase/epimerase [bacterium]|nr:sugar phosphate isomerase/epimerase [bacterium]